MFWPKDILALVDALAEVLSWLRQVIVFLSIKRFALLCDVLIYKLLIMFCTPLASCPFPWLELLPFMLCFKSPIVFILASELVAVLA